jgi:hypothetical protein
MRFNVYDRDMPIMRAHALASPQGLTDVIGFVLCTIQQPLQSVKAQMSDLRQNGAHSKYLFGSKRIGYAYALEHAQVLFAAVTKAVEVNDAIGARHWWNLWCETVAGNRANKRLTSADMVSAYHAECLAC